MTKESTTTPKTAPQIAKPANKDATMAYRYKRAYDLLTSQGKTPNSHGFVHAVIELAESDKEL